MGLSILLIQERTNTTPIDTISYLTKERVFHAVTTYLSVNLEGTRSSFCLFCRHSLNYLYLYTYIYYIIREMRKRLTGNAMQWSLKVFSKNSEYICIIKNKYYLCSRKGRTASSQYSEERWQSGRLRRS